MIRVLGGSLWASKAVRLALFCASVSLGVAALSPIAQAQPILILCSDDLAPQNFSCGTAASSNGGSSTAVGDAAAGFGTGTLCVRNERGSAFRFRDSNWQQRHRWRPCRERLDGHRRFLRRGRFFAIRDVPF